MEEKIPGPPPGTGPAGRKLWASVVTDFGLDPHEELLLVQAVRCADRLDAMAEALTGASLTVANRHGDQVSHPLLVESRQQSALLAKLLASLRLPSGDEDARPQRRGAARGAYGVRSLS
ncbi:hypothetical protein [Nocardiopsis sp. L17-MgMaSL7]|uniref:hypothetical protein n=1 Tax=Nocardiopsis sp. L17-MgMaSL7 TaxID=1938893 RepID=UPI000D8AB312|nr:hypothetical protein [Nocardiopsis sp. L17-MgMaSL7]PWV49219.1 hypothetical protein BDW27_10973 [Nocardiopsis sp. L17-MgMaSL7]